MKKNFAIIFLISVLLIFAGFLNLSCGNPQLTIVENGKPLAVIVTPENATQQVSDSAKLLSDYIKKSSNAEIPVVKKVSDKGKIAIHVGEDDYVRDQNLDIASLDGDGFVITATDSKNIIIAGPTGWGTEFGIYEFLERYVGVRWLMPGTDGEDVPAQSTISVPITEVRQEPAYFSRRLSSPNGAAWARKNRFHGRVEFHHNLLRLFPASKYTETHPEFYPIWDGKRYIPPSDTDHHWQPCFSADGIVDEAVKNIKAFFKAHPNISSYSLGMNDTNHFCQCEKCLAKEDPEKNFLGYRNYSDIYFEWANKVVEGVLEEYPDKWFGTLAYWNLAQPPKKVKVHERIIPYMTYGRIRWFDKEIEAEGHDLTEWWKSMSPVLGWYDYIYGTPYMVPRIWFHQMADYLKYGYDAGVRVYYGEIYYNWGEGPKQYLTLKLLWDPNIDVDEVLRDWYEHAVGKEAAPELAAYYSHWEKFWTERITQSSWFSKKGQWMGFARPGYLDIVTEEDISRSRKWLENAVAKAGTKKQKARASYLLRAFEYYEASALSFFDEMRAQKSVVTTENEALDIVNSSERYVSMKEKRKLLVDEFESDKILLQPLKPSRYVQLMGDRWGCYPLWRVYEWAKIPESKVSNRIDELTASRVGKVRNHALLMRDVLDNRVASLSKNPNFPKSLNGWKISTGEKGKASWTSAEGHNEAGALLGTGLGGCMLEQEVPIKNAGLEYTCLGFVREPVDQKSKGTVEISLTLLDKEGKVIDWHKNILNTQPGIWLPVTTTLDIPAIVGEREVKSIIVRMFLRDFKEEEKVFVDDLGLYAHKK